MRAIITVPANKRDAANSALAAKGFGSDNFSVPVIPQDRSPKEPPATHYTCNWAMTSGTKAEVERALDNAGVTAVWRPLKSVDPASRNNSSLDEVLAEQGQKKLIQETSDGNS